MRGNSQHEAEIRAHELVEREKLNDASSNFHLELVDGVFFVEARLGELLIGVPKRRERIGARRGSARLPIQSRRSFNSLRSFSKWPFHESLP